jgi:hypothetical protein
MESVAPNDIVPIVSSQTAELQDSEYYLWHGDVSRFCGSVSGRASGFSPGEVGKTQVRPLHVKQLKGGYGDDGKIAQ